jgi:hypothetical protein
LLGVHVLPVIQFRCSQQIQSRDPSSNPAVSNKRFSTSALRQLARFVFSAAALLFFMSFSMPAFALGAVTTTTLNPSTTSTSFGSSVTLSATVTSGAGTPDGAVVFFADLVSLGSATLDGSGQASLITTTLPIGLHAVVAVYVGNLNFLTSASISLNVNISLAVCTLTVNASLTTVGLGAAVNLTATVAGSGGTPTGQVTFTAGASVLGNATLNGSGQGTLGITTSIIGALSISASYVGDTHYLACIAPIIVITVNPGSASSTTSLSASPNPAPSGAPVSVTAVVSGAGGTPTGTVTFGDNGSTVGSAAVNGSGQATLTYTPSGGGNHALTANYVGDATFAASSATPVTLVVNGSAAGITTTTSLSSSNNPSLFGQPVTFTAAVTSSSGSPTGLVTFRDGGQSFGSVALSGGSASIVISSLGAGQHAITAAYGGNVSFAASVSAVLNQSISVPPDSRKLRDLQVVGSRIAAQTSGQAIASTIDAAIEEGFATNDQLLTPSAIGLRMTSAGLDRRDPRQARPDWILWSDLRQTSMNPGLRADVTGDQTNGFIGVTRRVANNLVAGAFGGYETFGYQVASLSGHLHGTGETLGAYVGWRFLPGLRFDVGIAQSVIDYDGVAGTASGSFAGARTLLKAAVVGTYKLAPDLELEPSARYFQLWESQNAYSDSLGIAQSERNFSTGRASVGAKVIYRWEGPFQIAVAPYAGVYADTYFNRDDAAAAASVVNVYANGSSARLVGGVAFTTASGVKVTTDGEVGGIAGNFTSFTFRTRGSVPF